MRQGTEKPNMQKVWFCLLFSMFLRRACWYRAGIREAKYAESVILLNIFKVFWSVELPWGSRPHGQIFRKSVFHNQCAGIKMDPIFKMPFAFAANNVLNSERACHSVECAGSCEDKGCLASKIFVARKLNLLDWDFFSFSIELSFVEFQRWKDVEDVCWAHPGGQFA